MAIKKFDTEANMGGGANLPRQFKTAGEQVQLENFPLTPAPTLSKIPADNVTNLVPETLPPTTIKPTDHVTSDGQTINSAIGSAQDFYSQISMNDIVDNTPSGAMSYAGYLAYNGLVDPRQQYAEDLDAANEMYARALGTYGMAGEGLAQGNLVNSGYSEYLNGNAYTQKAGWYRQALVDYQQKQNEYGAKYAQYKQDLAAQQAEEETQKDLPNEQIVNAYNYLFENVQSAGGLEAAKNYLAANGYSPEDIDAAIENWQSTNQADTQSNIDMITSLASGNAAALKQRYGSGEEYNKALAALQKKNGEMLDKFFDEDADWSNPEYYDFLSLYENEEGNAFDDMSQGEQIGAFKNYVESLYRSGDISKEQYQDFNAKTVIDATSELLKNENTAFKVFEELAKYNGKEYALGKDGLEKIYESISKRITFEKSGIGKLQKTMIVYTDEKGKKHKFTGVSEKIPTDLQQEAFEAYKKWYKNADK